MSKVKMISPAVPNVPWQDKPEDHTGAPVWRYSENPIIGRNPVKGVARIFNSAVMPYGDEFIGVFRYSLYLHGTQQRCNSLGF